jgi:putative Mg2+ transporter-C (MgtC) family protein
MGEMGALSYGDVFLRLGAAVFVGALIGLDRELRGKPAGLRTVALVALGSAVFVLSAVSLGSAYPSDSIPPVIQGIVTGIGFLGAGTIVRGQSEELIKGLTTAASVWLAAAVGVACGLALWPLVGAAVAFGVLILVFEPLEVWLKGRLTR